MDVVIVGAGPTGLLLAGDLAEAGLAVTVLERRSTSESNLTRAFNVHARTLEHLDMRGLADRLPGQRTSSMQLYDKVRIDFSLVPSKFNYVLLTPQYEVENLLRERAERFGATIEHDAEVIGLDQTADGVTVRTKDRAFEAKYVVGTDGVYSKVRELLGVPFPGRAAVKSLMLADVQLGTEPREALTVNAVGNGFALVAPFGDGWYRIFAWDRRKQVDDQAPVTLDEVRDITREVLGSDLGMHSPRWMSRFHSDERQARKYRVGRVFLAGDAAHCHSPAGGQGMNTGMQDAVNLGWKLAAVLNGHAREELLDTYQKERYPVGQAVLRSSGAILRMAMLKPRLAQQLRNNVGAVASRLPVLMRRVVGQVSGIDIRYGKHKRVPDLPLADGRLFEALRGGNFVLIANDPVTAPAHVRVVKPIEPVAEPILVRPDGYLG